MKTGQIVIILTVILAVYASNLCPQLCQQCESGICQKCYQDFTANSSYEQYPDTCGCPQGFFQNPNTFVCSFCPNQCQTCVNYTHCTSCEQGYEHVNNQCIISNKTSKVIEFAWDYSDEAFANYQSHGLWMINQIHTLDFTNYFDAYSCVNLQQNVFGNQYFDYQTILIRTFVGIPYHQYAKLKVQFVVIDNWEGQSMIIEVQTAYNPDPKSFVSAGAKRDDFPFDHRMRRNNFCGKTQYGDNIGLYDHNFPHTGSMMKLRIRPSTTDSVSPGNIPHMSYAIRQILLTVGTCPEGCNICDDTYCGPNCKTLYKYNPSTYVCECDTDVAILTANGGCISRCPDNSYYSIQAEKCLLCAQNIAGCLTCSASGCQQCVTGKFLYNGACLQSCPSAYQEAKNLDNIFICEQCSTGCISCIHDVCRVCAPGYLLSHGQCYEQCPISTYAEPNLKICLNCPENCKKCSSGNNCTECSTDHAGINYALINGECNVLCVGTNVAHSNNQHCETICSVNCEICLGQATDQCVKCFSPYRKRDFTCVDECGDGYYPAPGKCVKCRQECQTCTSNTCTACNNGYWLHNSDCIQKCPVGYYEHLSNRKCKECGQKCKVCFDDLTCKICKEGWFLNNGLCQQEMQCPSQTYYDIEYKSCFPCSENCLQCYKDLCYECESSKYLNNGKCVEECPEGKYKDSISNMCKWRDPLCQDYDETTGECNKCIHLDPPLVLDNDQINCLFSCPFGYTKQFSEDNSEVSCNLVCPTDCLECFGNQVCYKCSADLLLMSEYNPPCVQSCPEGYISDSIQCVKCQTGCKKCTINGKCIECYSNFGAKILVLNSIGQCVQETCSVGFKDIGNGVCVTCNSPCLTCTDVGTQCTSCVNGYYLYQNFCLADYCLSGYFKDPVSLHCKPCPPSCKQCLSYSVCTECFTGLYFYQNRCITECPAGYYISSETQSCSPCHSSCRTCFDRMEFQCLSCFDGNYLEGTYCTPQCPTGFYQDSEGYCDECSYLCQQCYGPAGFQCLSCKPGSHLFNGHCFDDCPTATYLNTQSETCLQCPQGCKTCTTNYSCSACQTGYWLHSGKCKLICDSQTYYSISTGQCLNCSIDECQQCTELGCKKCEQQYYLYHSTCVQECPPGTYLNAYHRQCRDCPSRCSSCTGPYSCLHCVDNFRLQRGVCLRQCETGFYYNGTSNQCMSCSDSSCQICTAISQCSMCLPGMYLFGNHCNQTCQVEHYVSLITHQCQPCHSSCLSCVNSSTNCLSCKPGHYLINNQCVSDQHEQCTVTGCSLCSETQQCFVCMTPYFLVLSTGTCQLQCPDGFYKNVRHCQPCSSACQKCTNSYNDCSACRQGFSLFNKRCLMQCPTGFYRMTQQTQIINQSGSSMTIYVEQCWPCSQNCVVCSNYTQCLLCNANSILVDGFCQQDCPSHYYISEGVCRQCGPNCITCASSEICIQCSVDTFLYEGNCTQIYQPQCPMYTYLVNINQCKRCSFPCLTCSDQTTCHSCVNGYSLHYNKCVIKCPTSYYSHLTANITQCQSCSLSCLTCMTESTICTSCLSPYYLSAKRCLISCPISTYPDPDKRVCQRCSDFCIHCSDYQTCLQCHPSMHLLNNYCVNQCPLGYSSTLVEMQVDMNNKILSICQPCSFPCAQCSKESVYYCLSCVSGYYIHGDRCLENCPEGYYADTQNTVCRACSPICATCVTFSQCTSCMYSSDPSTGQCLPQSPCPAGGCTTCPQQCEYCYQGTCHKCYSNFYLQSNNCISQCPTGSYPSPNFGTCTPYPPQNNCQSGLSLHQCNICTTTSVLYNGQCLDSCPQLTIYNTQLQICQVNKCLAMLSDGSCRSCVAPYYLLDGQCVGECPVGHYMSEGSCESCVAECLACVSYRKCSQCGDGYVLYEGQCLAQCPSGYYASENICGPCPIGCLACQSDTQCTYCSTGTYLSAGQCLQQCPMSTYQAHHNNTCRQCPAHNCLSCSNNTFCQLCNHNSFLHNGQCQQSCPQGYYTSTLTAIVDSTELTLNYCSKCSQNCLNCTSSTICHNCGPGSFLYMHTCIQFCPAGTFTSYSSSTNKCVPCSLPCTDCYQSSNSCLECQAGYSLLEAQCWEQCPQGYYGQFGRCKKCSSFCLDCENNAENCVVCYDGMVLQDGQCVSTCTLPTQYYDHLNYYCRSCSSQCYQCYGPRYDQCLSCSYPLVLSGSTCTMLCTPGSYASLTTYTCIECQPTCLQCESLANMLSCIQCRAGFYLVQGSCARECPTSYYQNPSTGLCQTCSTVLLGCSDCSFDAMHNDITCQQCQTGRVFNQDGDCILIAECPTPTMIIIDQTCQFCSALCLSCSLNNQNQQICLECKDGYSLSTGSSCVSECPIYETSMGLVNSDGVIIYSCYACPENCLVCGARVVSGAVETLCQRCVQPYFLDVFANLCVLECSSLFIQQYTPIYQCIMITTPEQQYHITSCSQQNLLTLMDTYECVQICPPTYYRYLNTDNHYVCMVCPAGCSTCISQTVCHTCLPGFKLLNNVECLAMCPSTHLQLGSKCYECVPPCSSCMNSLTQCSACLGGKLLHGATCLDVCPVGFYPVSGVCKLCPQKCDECDASGICTTCSNIYYSAPGCTDTMNICDTVEYLYTSSDCDTCHETCLTCFGPSQYSCLTCQSPSVLVQSQCRTGCPSGFTFQSNQCISCSSQINNCQQCSYTSSWTCLNCQPPYILHNGICLHSCSQLNSPGIIYYLNNNNQQCQQCTIGCALCSDGNCLQCVATKLLKMLGDGSKECVDVCGDGYYESSVGSSVLYCLPCGGYCETCSNGNSCDLCIDSYPLYQQKCVDTCPVGTYLNTDTNVCYNCNNTLTTKCLSCQYVSGSPICLSCVPPYYPSADGSCKLCLSGYYYSSTQASCLMCNSTCLTCNSNTYCTNCKSGWLLSAGQCINSCPVSTYPDGTSCTPCTTTACLICDNTDTCTECQNTYGLYLSQCLDNCPTGTFLTNKICQPCQSGCSACLSTNTCNQCLTSFYLYLGDCLSACPQGYTNDANNVCMPCKAGCQVCSNAGDTCEQCQVGFVDNGDGSCLYSGGGSLCDTGQYSKNDGCYPCYATCLECNEGGPFSCLSCMTGYNLTSAGSCISNCPTHQFYSTSTSSCQQCSANCAQCVNLATECRQCLTGQYLSTSKTCENQCQVGEYLSNSVCYSCPTLCNTCTSATTCQQCSSPSLIMFNSMCYQVCPPASYPFSATICNPCPTGCRQCTSNTACITCFYPYSLSDSQCVQNCPAGTYSSRNLCIECPQGCTSCNQNTCFTCSNNLFLNEGSCQSTCPLGKYQNIDICTLCPQNCASCTSPTHCVTCVANYVHLVVSDVKADCLVACPDAYVNIGGQCTNSNCMNCQLCVDGECLKCDADYYLFQLACTEQCNLTFFGNNQTYACQPCMQDCLLCPNSTYCDLCIQTFNFTSQTGCVSQSYIIFGAFSNMSGITSNITEITSMVYLTTSVGPVAFGQMASTYFNVEFCQFLFFHENITAGNQQLTKFLESLSYMSMSSGISSLDSRRRLLFTSDSINFLEVNVPIFILMGAFLGIYLLVFIIQKNIENCCLSCPRLNFYVKQICIYLRKRFKWIYFDFVLWLSYLPFLYFALLQVQKFNFDSGLQGFGSILSVAILLVYPLYPVFICYHIKKNYVEICKQNNSLIQMSFSPWLSKIKRPEQVIQDQQFRYFTKANFILIYYPLKYFRKFIFVLVVALCPIPIVSLGILIGLNIIFICYMGAFRPRKMPYMVFDFIVEGILLGFEIFLLIYVSFGISDVNAMSIATHAIGFITANGSIIIAIILNLVAYYHIFLCLYNLYKHLKQKIEQKQKNDLKDNSNDMYSDNDNLHPSDLMLMEKEMMKNNNQDIRTEDLDDQERRVAKYLTDKDLIINNIQPRFDGDITEDQLKDLLNDKDINQYFKNGQGKFIRKNDQMTESEGEDVKTQNLSEEGREIAKHLTDKDLVINRIQPRYDNIRQSQHKNLFGDKDMNDYYDNQINNNKLKKGNIFGDKDLDIEGYRPEFDEENPNNYDNHGNLLGDKELFEIQNKDKYKMYEDGEDQLPMMKNKKKKNKKDKKNSKKKLLENLSQASDDHMFESPEFSNKNEKQVANARLVSSFHNGTKDDESLTRKIQQGKISNINSGRDHSKKIENEGEYDVYYVGKNNQKPNNQIKKEQPKNLKADPINIQPKYNEKNKNNMHKLQRNQFNKDSQLDSSDYIVSQNDSKINLVQRGHIDEGKMINVDTKKTKKHQKVEEAFDEFIEDQEIHAVQEANMGKHNKNSRGNLNKNQDNVENADFVTRGMAKDKSKKNVYYNGEDDVQEMKYYEKKRNNKNRNQNTDEMNPTQISLKQRKGRKKSNQSYQETQQQQFYEREKKRYGKNNVDEADFYQRNPKNAQDKQSQLDSVNFRSRKSKQNSKKKIGLEDQQGIPSGQLYQRNKQQKISGQGSFREGEQQYQQVDEGLLISRKPTYKAEKPKQNKTNSKELENLKMKEREQAKKEKEQLRFTRGGADVIDQVDEGLMKSVNPKIRHQEAKNDGKPSNQVIYQEAEEPQQLKQKKKQQGGFFSNLFGLNKKDQSQEKVSYLQKKKNDSEQFEQSNFGSRPSKSKQEEKNRNNSYMGSNSRPDDVQDEDIQRRKRQSEILAPKFKAPVLNFGIDDSFAQEPNSRRSKVSNNKQDRGQDSGLHINEKGSDISDEQYKSKLHKSPNRRKNRKKGKLNLNEKSETFNEQDEIIRKQKQEESLARKRGTGQLHIDKRDDEFDQDDLEKIEL